ncbi:hypothetical protein IJ117_00495 [Candidatus Saccharibacteria bacterium]|nr:hypothetical protein [Candidatus Saccharibacteria bacterium]
MRIKKGDTLIEVAIAIAIFSLVAISVVAVVNGSTSASQSALEITVSREEIDTQAEALRFIQNSYMAGGQSNVTANEKYKFIWEAITARAVDNSKNPTLFEQVLNYNPPTCSELYDVSSDTTSRIFNENAFIINTHMLGYEGSGRDMNNDPRFIRSDASRVIATPSRSNNAPFYPAATYPRLIYGTDTNALLDDTNSKVLNRVEGIYIVAVKDNQTTTIVNNGVPVSRQSAFYDFYIRTCWFGPGADRPSTVSTVVRLQDPTLIDY